MNNGFSIGGYDNNSHMCATADKVFENMPGLETCLSCGFKIDFTYINKDFNLRKKVNDLSFTYDGYCIVSLKFKEACNRHNIAGADFIALPKENGYFFFRPNRIIEFDHQKRKTRFENMCEECGNYESVTGNKPAYIKGNLTAGFFRTDILFGSGNEKSPLIIVSEQIKYILEQEKIKGVIYAKISA